MIEALREPLAAAEGLELSLREEGAPVSFGAALQRLRDDEGFRARLFELLASAPFEAFFWECPPITRATLEQPFRFALVDAPALARVRADRGPFERELARAERGVATFRNLGGDALLVAPARRFRTSCCAHLAAFARGARAEEQHELLRRVALAAEEELDERPLWISTSGLGVHWLHVRLDRRPKYYTHAPYRAFP